MNRLHQKLLTKSDSYRTWHNHPRLRPVLRHSLRRITQGFGGQARHPFWHWIVFLSVAIVSAFYLTGAISNYAFSLDFWIVPIAHAQSTADPNALPVVKDLYAWFNSLSSKTNQKLLSSEQIVLGGTSGWQSKLTNIQNADGGTPVGMIGVGYSHPACPGQSWCSGTDGIYTIDSNAAAKYYWGFSNKRLTYMIGFFPSPVDLSATGVILGGSSDNTNASDSTISQAITDNGNSYNLAWRRILDGYVPGLQDLQNSGIPVIFQPFNEFDGDWFWWCHSSDTTFINLWRYTFNYFTSRGIHNVLWHYSPNTDDRPGAYPGDAYVDFVGIDPFNCPSGAACGPFRGYASLTTNHPSKPFGIAGFGPSCANNLSADASYNCYNYGDLVPTIHNSNPKVAFLNIWWVMYSLENHPKGAPTYMGDSWIINGNNLSWFNSSAYTTPPSPPTNIIVQ